MKTLIVGNGGREHALAWKLAQSPRVDEVFIAPGNAGTALLGKNLPIGAEESDRLAMWAEEKKVELTVVGPEVPLALGIVDTFQSAGLPIFGPTQAAAQLEASKVYAKQFMQEFGIPTAEFAAFNDYEQARAYVRRRAGPIVVKASGLAAGKGVIVCDNLDAALAALQRVMADNVFGNAGDEIVIEERLSGPEVSLLAFCDGTTAVPMLPARDHKRAYNGNAGPNTGGMGVFAPPPDVDAALVREIMDLFIYPAVRGMAQRGTPYVGVLYAGLILTKNGPKLLEYNCRFGDPETQAILPLLDGDLAEIMLACLDGTLAPEMVRVRPGAAATVVMASGGYPGVYRTGLPILGLGRVPDDTTVFHAGTRQEGNQIVTNGGRVLAISAIGDDLDTAVSRAYAGVAAVHFDGMHFRKDIGR